MDAAQIHYVTSYGATELWTFHCERVRKMPLSGLGLSMVIGLPCKTEADWINLRRRVKRYVCLILVKTYTNGPCSTSFSTVVDPPSWLDLGDSLESMLDSEEDKDDM